MHPMNSRKTEHTSVYAYVLLFDRKNSSPCIPRTAEKQNIYQYKHTVRPETSSIIMRMYQIASSPTSISRNHINIHISVSVASYETKQEQNCRLPYGRSITISTIQNHQSVQARSNRQRQETGKRIHKSLRRLRPVATAAASPTTGSPRPT
jgi:hypothetical protein